MIHGWEIEQLFDRKLQLLLLLEELRKQARGSKCCAVGGGGCGCGGGFDRRSRCSSYLGSCQ